jgi:hypothetical protein
VRSRLALLFLLAASLPCNAQEPATNVSVHALGDYYWVVQDHDEVLQNRNGVWFSPVFLTVDKTLDNAITARFRLAANERCFLDRAVSPEIVMAGNGAGVGGETDSVIPRITFYATF